MPHQKPHAERSRAEGAPQAAAPAAAESGFDRFDLPEFLRRALRQLKFTEPTPVQAEAIPAGIQGRDVIVSAMTGAGKTAAFCLPIISHLSENSDGTALILVPTRELAVQIADVVAKLTANQPRWRPALLIGGDPFFKQVKMVKSNPRIVVATPGRLIDHLDQGTVTLEYVTHLVLDEADRMLDMGFAPQLERILQDLPPGPSEGELPPFRQTMLFSATLAPNVRKVAEKFLTNPVSITIGTEFKAPEKIQQSVIQVTQQEKQDKLIEELERRPGQIIVFARTKQRCDRIYKRLAAAGQEVARIHGDRTQGQRRQAIDGFRSNKIRILVATDIAARGLDVPSIACVINYDLPMVAEDYVHRIGRTGRNGAEGEAVCFVAPEEKQQFRAIQRMMGGELEAIQEYDGGRRGGQPQRRGGQNRGGGRPQQGQGQGRPQRRDDRRGSNTRNQSGGKSASQSRVEYPNGRA